MLVRSDINGNITRLEERAAVDQHRMECIFSIVEDEIAAGTTKESASATNGLLWLKRCAIWRSLRGNWTLFDL